MLDPFITTTKPTRFITATNTLKFLSSNHNHYSTTTPDLDTLLILDLYLLFDPLQELDTEVTLLIIDQRHPTLPHLVLQSDWDTTTHLLFLVPRRNTSHSYTDYSETWNTTQDTVFSTALKRNWRFWRILVLDIGTSERNLVRGRSDQHLVQGRGGGRTKTLRTPRSDADIRHLTVLWSFQLNYVNYFD